MVPVGAITAPRGAGIGDSGGGVLDDEAARRVDTQAGFGADAFASCNRTCELGMTKATGESYVHVLELLERATR